MTPRASAHLTLVVSLAAALLASMLVLPPAAAQVLEEQVVEEDDAGSGRDAGQTAATAVPIDRGQAHRATLIPKADGVGLEGEDYDRFSFQAVAGETIDVALLAVDVDGAPTCIFVYDTRGARIADSGCSDSLTFTAPGDGTYYAEFGYFAVVPTGYAFGVDVQETLRQTYAEGGRDLQPDPAAATVVVAVADSGVNPYHEAYYRPNLTVHPCRWVAGFDDCDVPALDLSIGEHDTYEEALAADAEVWAQVQVGEWYWIPRTNIIGAVCDDSLVLSDETGSTGQPERCILDEDGHGTGTTSSVLSEAPDALLLVHEGNSGASALAYAPVVPDIQSHSWAPPAPLPLHLTDPATDPLGPRLGDRGPKDPETLFFLAAGNEAPLPTIVDSNRVDPRVQIVGGGFPGRATTSSWSMFDFASWFCRPTAEHRSTTAVRASYCGTSFAAPTVAGTAAAALLDLRRAEGYTGRSTVEHVTPTVSRETFVASLRAAATYAPEQRYAQTGSLGAEVDMPEGTEHLFWGYGFLDATDVDAVVACATGGECPTKSAAAQAWNEARQEARRAQAYDQLTGRP